MTLMFALLAAMCDPVAIFCPRLAKKMRRPVGRKW
jgi:hypothetical protein